MLTHEKITITETRAKRSQTDNRKDDYSWEKGDLHARRQALSYLTDDSVVHKVFDELAKRYDDRPGGYVRIIKLGFRRAMRTYGHD